MRFFVVVDLWLDEAVELYVRRDAAERMVAELLRDEPQWRGLFRVEPIEFAEFSRN